MKNMGNAYYKKGDKEKAKYWYEQALKNKDKLEQQQIDNIQQWLKELQKQ